MGLLPCRTHICTNIGDEEREGNKENAEGTKKGGREEARKRTASGIAKSSGKRPNATVAEADLKQCRSGKKEGRGRESESVDPAPDLCPPPLRSLLSC